MAPDELSSLFEKARSTANSANSLFGELLRLYDSNETGRVVIGNETEQRKGRAHTKLTDAHLAIFSSATPPVFERIWQGTSGASSGLQSRFVLSYSDQRIPPFQEITERQVVAGIVGELAYVLKDAPTKLTMSNEAQEAVGLWSNLKAPDAPQRILDMGKRCAMNLAACAGTAEIDLGIMELALDFATYQYRVKDRLMAPDADGNVQAFENRVIAFYTRVGQATLREARNSIRPERYPGGFNAFERACGCLVRTGKLRRVGENRSKTSIFELD